jgi:hypothetical protein
MAVRPVLVEGLALNHGHDFDKLSPNGFCEFIEVPLCFGHAVGALVCGVVNFRASHRKRPPTHGSFA